MKSPDERGRGAHPAPGASVTADFARHERTGRSSQVASSSPTSRERGAPPEASLPFDGFLKHYEIIRKLGEGGMGIVLLARDIKLGRLVAIKLLQDSGHATTRLLAEARATARCKHENIVVIHDVDETDGHPYMVLEYLEGRTLREVLSSGARGSSRVLPRGLALDIVMSVLRALVAAHERDVVHRDLKPENIMILDAGGVKVLDFGLARPGDGLYTSDGGTLAYMAPEQWLGEKVDARADIWAVGVILYELLAGAHPLEPITMERLESVADLSALMPKLRDVLPELSALSDVVERCLRKRKEERFASADELLAALTSLREGGKPLALASGELPFAGLSTFQEADAGRFFGRERDIAALVGRLRRQRLVTVVGPSGAGKSSFLRAGVIPALKHSGENWDVLVLRPGRAPMSALGEALAEVLTEGKTDDPVAMGDLRAEPGLLGARLRAHCRAQGPESRALVFVDQFEELYTLVSDPGERSAFLQCLLGVADDASSPLRVIVALRSDFLDRVAEDSHFLAEAIQGLLLLPPMGREALREALVRPVEASGHRFEDEAMITDILDELSRAKTPLPLLQFSAAEVWEARDRDAKTLTRASYERLGGVVGSLSTHADAVFAALSLPSQRLCQAIFLRLVTPERTRAIVSMPELASLAEDPAAVEALVQHLCGARLLLLEVGGLPGTVTVELVHESLIERWPRLARWLDESTADAQFMARLRAAASQWQAGGEASGLLWRDRAAEEARAWYERRRGNPEAERGMPLGRAEERYLLAVIDLQEQARRRRQRSIAGAFVVLGTVSVLVFVLAMRAQAQARRADAEAARVTEQNGELALQALRGRNATRMLATRRRMDDPTLVLALAREVEPEDIPKEWAEIVSGALSSGVARNEIAGLHGGLPVYAAAISPDGARIVTASQDQTASILAVGDFQRLATLRGHDAHVWFAAWSPDGARIVTASGDKTARIWSADGSGEPLVLRGHEDEVNSALMSPDGQRVVTASMDGTARVFRAADGRQIAVLEHQANVTSARFSPDGKSIVTTSVDGLARVWSADDKGAPLVLRGHTDEVVAATWSPDGARIATTSKDATVRVWDAFEGAERLTLRGHEDKVMSVAWSRDGKRIASASKDKTARIWNADGAGQPIVLRGHKHWVYTADFSPDGRSLLTASLDRTLRFWNLDEVVAPRLLEGHTEVINAITWSPDGARLVTASGDGTARVWRADGEGSPVVLRGHTRDIVSARWSPDGARLVTASRDGTARVWRLDDPSSPVVLDGHRAGVWSVDWSDSGDRILTASMDGGLRVWASDGYVLQAETKAPIESECVVQAWFEPAGTRVLVSYETGDIYLWNAGEAGEAGELVGLAGHTGRFVPSFTGARWSPDGSRILSTFADCAARVWDVRGAAAPVTLQGHESKFTFAAWSPDGARILTTSLDGTARVWSADGSGQPGVLHGHRERVVSAWMSPDGTRVATASADTTVRIFRADGSGQPFVLGGSPFVVGSAEWSADGKYIAQCSDEKVARVWRDVEPFTGPEDARLWRATSYCIPVPIRRELLQITEAEAQRDQQACERRVAEARAAERNPGPTPPRDRVVRP
ncbi:nSTAND1 domain-containing NTPase [Polyangium mundeleinium]|uniref:Protein kinase n=1 Tax=Polyangium mundeleinium TaxID=2995306 RepID=A0ABT5F1M8_9BACT|nr:protein kinase [Polyangium mundeleinium]MDC0747901.1 protein kinase [Polyangium mundeleinium]